MDSTSIFKSYTDQTPMSVTWEEIFQMISSEYLRENTEKYRYYLQQGMKKEADKIKKASYGFTPAVVCEGGRKAEHIVALTGFSMADFDHLPPDDLSRCMALLDADPYAFLAYITISGNGIRIIFRVDNIDHYAEAYRQGNEYFAKLIGHAYDAQCKNPARLSGMCYDAQALFHPEAKSLHIIPKAIQSSRAGHSGKCAHATVKEVEKQILSELEQSGLCYEPGRHNEYISNALYSMNRFGVSETEAGEWALKMFSDYGAEQVEDILHSVYRNVEEHGSRKLPKNERKRYATLEEVEAFVTSQAKLRYNVITGRREICMKEDTQFRDISDRDENTLWCRANKSGVRTNFKSLQLLLNSEFVPQYNPLKEYFENLPEWDGETDYIGQLASTVQTTTQETFIHCFRKWLVAMLASLLDEKTINHEVLVFIGIQGAYKTSWFNKLLPPELIRYYRAKQNSSQMNKDDLFTLVEFALICFEEIDCIRSYELNQLKAMITLETISERPAYARNKDSRPHIASFCGTGNNMQFLSDPTGNRRWLPFEIVSIADPHTYVLPYKEIYAQAYHLYKNGFRYWFSQEEIKLLNKHNEAFEVPNLEEELIRNYYRKPAPGEIGTFITTARILEHINGLIKVPLSPTKIGITMRKIGFDGFKQNGVRGYRAIELSIEEINENKRVKESVEEPKLPF